MAQKVSHWPLTAEVLLQSHASPRKVCGGPSDTGRGFLPFLRCNRLTCTVTPLLSGGQGVELGNFQTNCGTASFHSCPSLRLRVVAFWKTGGIPQGKH